MCERTPVCPFFTTDAGYSPELNKTMREKYCLTDNSDCARMIAITRFGEERVPVWLLPTDHDKLDSLAEA